VRLLLDAHALIWAVDDPSKPGVRADEVIGDPANPLLVGAGTIWEISIKVGLNKLTLSLPFGEWMSKAIADLGATIVPITIEHAAVQSQMSGRGDPFDRLLAAQSQVDELTVVSGDSGLDQYGVQRLW
jgi:PIN domain nuclease of toxin-antitoxin system